MNDNNVCSWPEQDAVDAWLKKHNISVSNKQALELKKNVSKYRIQLQSEPIVWVTHISALRDLLGRCLQQFEEHTESFETTNIRSDIKQILSELPLDEAELEDN